MTSEYTYVALPITKKVGILLAVYPQHRRGDRASSNSLADVLACQPRRWSSTEVQNIVDVELQGRQASQANGTHRTTGFTEIADSPSPGGLPISQDDISPERPIPNSYWVSPGRLAAGEYPGSHNHSEASRKLRDLVAAGVDHFVDLTDERDWLEPYDQTARDEGRRIGKTVHCESRPITDVSVPDHPDVMTGILDAIDTSLETGHTVYVHCWGGVGRTGTVIGCWLVRHGLTGDEALEQIAEWWKEVEKAERVPFSPETHEQQEYVRRWTEEAGT